MRKTGRQTKQKRYCGVRTTFGLMPCRRPLRCWAYMQKVVMGEVALMVMLMIKVVTATTVVVLKSAAVADTER